MLGYQTLTQGSTAGLSFYGTRTYSYALPTEHLVHSGSGTVHWSDASKLRQNLKSSSWTSSLRQYTGDVKTAKEASAQPMATSTVELADLPRLVDIEFAAFRDEKINHHLSYRDGSKSGHIRRTLRMYRKYMNNLRYADEHQSSARFVGDSRARADSAHERAFGFKFRKVESPLGGEIIAFCKSEILELSLEEMASALDAGHEGEPQMNRDWFALNERCHREYCGIRKHCYFGMLATHPDHQHQGAASMLMDELVAEADNTGLEIYCEATRTGRPLYEKYGFVAVREIVFATGEYGVDLGVERQTVMVRGALGEDGKRQPVRPWNEAVAHSAREIEQSTL